MRLLIACEESQEVTMAFRAKGHEAYSCDILPCSGGHPEWHIQDDALKIAAYRKWDRIISFPPCTDLAVSGARWFEQKRMSGEQLASIKFFLDIWIISDAVENPRGIMTGWSYVDWWFPELRDLFKLIDFPKRERAKRSIHGNLGIDRQKQLVCG